MRYEKLNKFFLINIPDNFLSPAEAVRHLDVSFHSDFSFSGYVENTCKAFLLKFWISSTSEGISHVMLLFYL